MTKNTIIKNFQSYRLKSYKIKEENFQMEEITTKT